MVSRSKWGQFLYVLEATPASGKKIRCISLLQQHALQGVSKFTPLDNIPMAEDVAANSAWLQTYLSDISLDENDSDVSVLFFVRGYIARTISRRRKCDGCQNLLIKSSDCPSIQTFLEGDNMRLLELAHQGGLAVPTDYCFTVCLMATQTYEKIVSCDATKELWHRIIIEESL